MKASLLSTNSKIQNFVNLFTDLRAKVLKSKLTSSVNIVLESIFYRDYLLKRHPDQYTDKLENVHELAAAINNYYSKNPNASLCDWLQSITLTREDGEPDVKGVSVMTLHMAKGLEFERVHIVVVEEGLLPHRNNMDKIDLLEEERRLFYVGMTRARQKLSLYCAAERMLFSQTQWNEPSRFLREIPSIYVKANMPQKNSYELSSSSEGIHYDFDDLPNVMLGQPVFHPTYGSGIIENIEQSYGEAKVVVNFKEFGLRRVSLRHLSIA
jgi:DNA helicase-2/ATP-dependent DNA helicase PcrA